jgi:maltose O-acetyltransferase
LWPEDLRAQELLYRFNLNRHDAGDERRTLLSELFDRFGAGAVLRPSFRCDYGGNISFGTRDLPAGALAVGSPAAS